MAQPKKKSTVVTVIDLSDRCTSAVVFQQNGEEFAVLDYASVESPGSVASLSRAQLAQHFKAVIGALAIKAKETVLVVGVQDATVRTVELPHYGGTNLRSLLKLNTARFFKHDVSEFIFDCVPLTSAEGAFSDETSSDVLVVGIKEEVFDRLARATADAGLRLTSVTSRQVGLANMCRMSRADSYLTEVSVLIDVGPKAWAVSALIHGQPMLTRVIDIDEKLGAEIDEAFTTPYPVAEEIRANLIRTRLQKALFRLGQEISAAIDFFEAQLNCRVSIGVFAGGTERKDLIIETLQAQLDVRCHPIDPTSAVQLSLPATKRESGARELPKMAGAIGAGAAVFHVDLLRINLLAESIEARAQRRRDPVRLSIMAAAAVVTLMLGWWAYIRYDLARTTAEAMRLQSELTDVKKNAGDAGDMAVANMQVLTTALALEQHSTNRFLVAPALDALQYTLTDQIQVVRVSLQNATLTVPAVKAVVKDGIRSPGKRGYSAEKISIFVQAKSFGERKAENAFMDNIAQQSYFQKRLRNVDPVTLKSRGPRQVDPLDPNKVYTLFTIECAYPEKILGYED